MTDSDPAVVIVILLAALAGATVAAVAVGLVWWLT